MYLRTPIQDSILRSRLYNECENFREFVLYCKISSINVYTVDLMFLLFIRADNLTCEVLLSSQTVQVTRRLCDLVTECVSSTS